MTLGTGFGTAWFLDGALLPHLEFAHVPVHRKQDFDAYIGDKQRRKQGLAQWNKRVKRTLKILATVFNYEHLYIGGGNASRIRFKLPPHVSLVPNEEGMRGAAFVWNPIGKKSTRADLKTERFAPGAMRGAEGAKKKVSASRKTPGRSSRPGKARRPKV